MPELLRYTDSARKIITISVFGIVLFLIIAQGYASLPPKNFKPVEVSIPAGSSVKEIGYALKKAGVIKSSSAFAVTVAVAGAELSLDAGTYAFDKPESLSAIVYRLKSGDTRAKIEITLPEGLTRKEMAKILSEKLPSFSSSSFLKSTEGEEGYLFPDTYHFDPNVNTEAVAEQMRGNFREKIALLKDEIATSKRSLSDLIIMASIIEKEATSDSREIVSGILWRRLDDGMALQVDAPFIYTIGKSSRELTKEDLAKDGPFNTYTRTGLPPSPIGNPGVAAIRAAINPAEDDYRYFLTGKDGEMYFGKTFEEHQINRQKYL